MQKKIFTVILMLLTASLFLGHTGGSNSSNYSSSPGDYTGALNSLTSSTDAIELYSNAFNHLSGAGEEIQNAIEGLLKASPKIINEITRRWNNPAEKMSYRNYRKIFITRERFRAGKKFHDQHRELIHQISAKYKVDEYLLLSIVGVESMYGASHADYRVVDVFHTIAHDVPRKRKWAEKELTQFIDFCAVNGVNPGDVKGSYAAAIGYPQFIPSSLNYYGRDHDGDGKVDLYTWEDTLESVANYLVKHRYNGKSRDYSKGSRNWKSIYAYNHSENYVKVIIEFKKELKKTIESS